MNENITLEGYNSKKQAYIYLVVSIFTITISVLLYFLAEGNKKYASIPLLFIGVGFLIGYFHFLKLPKLAFKVIDNRFIHFYDKGTEKVFDLHEVEKIHYWKANFGLKIIIFTSEKREYLAYLLEDAKNVKSKLIELFKQYDIKIINRYSK